MITHDATVKVLPNGEALVSCLVVMFRPTVRFELRPVISCYFLTPRAICKKLPRLDYRDFWSKHVCFRFELLNHAILFQNLLVERYL